MSRPNILLIMSDEHAPHFSSVYGHPLVRTPHLERLAAAGVTFDAAYCNAPICVPSRASFMTGKHVHRIGVWDNWTPLGSDTVTWAHLLRAAGYRVLLDGKMHFVGPDRLHGFERQLTRDSTSGIDVFPKGERISDEEIARFRRRVEEAGPGRSRHVDFDDDATAAAVDWLRREAPKDEPWCLVVGLLSPHFPLVAAEEYFSQYYPDNVDLPAVSENGTNGADGADEAQAAHPAHARMRHFFGLHGLSTEQILRARAAYYGLVTYMDSKVGELLAALNDTGTADRTMVVYTADHGEMAGEHGLWWKNSFYDESSRVPLIVRWPTTEHRQAGVQGVRGLGGTRFPGVVSLVDLAHTLLEVAGAEDPGDLDGDSFLAAVLAGQGGTAGSGAAPSWWKDEAFCEYYGPATDRPHRMLRVGRWKYAYYHGEPAELYDIQADPHERRSLSVSLPPPDHSIPGGEPACHAIEACLRRRVLAGWDPAAISAAIQRSAQARRRVASASRGSTMRRSPAADTPILTGVA